ncbi:MAG: GNAT family N-acetyltransferase [Bacteroidales bacterium]|nr:GNAT family N-acetyltransferase [Bacteroidales bacterium]
MNLSYREIKKSDYQFLREILYDALFIPEGEKPPDKTVVDLPEISKYIDNWGLSTDFGIIAHMNEQPVGAIWGRLFNKNKKGYGFVDENTPELTMAVKSECRNQGVGESLISRFFQLARDKGYKYLSLSVDKRNRACNFYLRQGFEIVGELDSSYTMKTEI